MSGTPNFTKAQRYLTILLLVVTGVHSARAVEYTDLEVQTMQLLDIPYTANSVEIEEAIRRLQKKFYQENSGHLTLSQLRLKKAEWNRMRTVAEQATIKYGKDRSPLMRQHHFFGQTDLWINLSPPGEKRVYLDLIWSAMEKRLTNVFQVRHVEEFSEYFDILGGGDRSSWARPYTARSRNSLQMSQLNSQYQYVNHEIQSFRDADLFLQLLILQKNSQIVFENQWFQSWFARTIVLSEPSAFKLLEAMRLYNEVPEVATGTDPKQDGIITELERLLMLAEQSKGTERSDLLSRIFDVSDIHGMLDLSDPEAERSYELYIRAWENEVSLKLRGGTSSFPSLAWQELLRVTNSKFKEYFETSWLGEDTLRHYVDFMEPFVRVVKFVDSKERLDYFLGVLHIMKDHPLEHFARDPGLFSYYPLPANQISPYTKSLLLLSALEGRTMNTYSSTLVRRLRRAKGEEEILSLIRKVSPNRCVLGVQGAGH
ncbi:MAG: hypothetical protein KDD61_04870 [Bdellovibrionales bacterium]|nr:hypothetical protein [Bdellovibrionales bacterium]